MEFQMCRHLACLKASKDSLKFAVSLWVSLSHSLTLTKLRSKFMAVYGILHTDWFEPFVLIVFDQTTNVSQYQAN